MSDVYEKMEDKIKETFSSHAEIQDQKKEGKVLVMTSVLNLEPDFFKSVFITVYYEATNVDGRGTKIWLQLI